MACNIEYRSYKDSPKLNRREIQAELDDYVSHADFLEGASGLPSRIKWIDAGAPFSTADEAEDYIEERYGNRDKYACVAVKYYEVQLEDLKTDKAYMELTAKIKEAREKHDSYSKEKYIRTLKSKTITCRKCGCGIPTAHWNSDFCPVCLSDIRPDSLKAREEKLKESINRLYERREARLAEIAKKGKKVSWLIRFGYHT